MSVLCAQEVAPRRLPSCPDGGSTVHSHTGDRKFMLDRSLYIKSQGSGSNPGSEALWFNALATAMWHAPVRQIPIFFVRCTSWKYRDHSHMLYWEVKTWRTKCSKRKLQYLMRSPYEISNTSLFPFSSNNIIHEIATYFLSFPME